MKQFIKQPMSIIITFSLLFFISGCATAPSGMQDMPTNKQKAVIDKADSKDAKGEEKISESSNTKANEKLDEHKQSIEDSKISSTDTTSPPSTDEKKKEEEKKLESKKDKKKKREEKKLERKETQKQEETTKEISPPLTLESVLAEKRLFSSKEDKIQFCKTLNENSQVFHSVTLTSVNALGTTSVRKEIDEPFKAKFSIENPSLMKDINFIVEYPVKTASATTFSYASLKADNEGLISFKPPKSDFSIDGEVKVYLDLLQGENLAEDARIINENITDSLKTKIITSFSYKVATGNKRISAAIAILDYDKNGKAILNENIVANRLFVKMMRTGFSRAGLAPFETLAKLEGVAIINHAKSFFKNAVEYYVFGKSYIKNLEKRENNTWECKVECTLYVWNLKQDKQILEFNLSRTETGKTQGDAIKKARINLGEEEMYNKLLYNL